MNNKKGFTLIELLVVIAIIGILATVVMVALSSARGKAKDSAVQSDVRNMMSAVELYLNDNELPIHTKQTLNDSTGLGKELIDEGLVNKVPIRHGQTSNDTADGYWYMSKSGEYVICGKYFVKKVGSSVGWFCATNGSTGEYSTEQGL